MKIYSSVWRIDGGFQWLQRFAVRLGILCSCEANGDEGVKSTPKLFCDASFVFGAYLVIAAKAIEPFNLGRPIKKEKTL